jgi:hypothetical protein
MANGEFGVILTSDVFFAPTSLRGHDEEDDYCQLAGLACGRRQRRRSGD